MATLASASPLRIFLPCLHPRPARHPRPPLQPHRPGHPPGPARRRQHLGQARRRPPGEGQRHRPPDHRPRGLHPSLARPARPAGRGGVDVRRRDDALHGGLHAGRGSRAERRDPAAFAAAASRHRPHPRRRDDEPHQRHRRRRRAPGERALRGRGRVRPLQPPRLSARPLGEPMVDRIPDRAIGLTLAHHGLVVWGDDAEEAHARLVQFVARIDEYIATSRRGRLLLGAVADRRRRPRRGAAPPGGDRAPGGTRRAERARRVILHFDDADDILATLAAERMPELAGRGMATPEHLLRAGRLPVWLDLDLAAAPDALWNRCGAGGRPRGRSTRSITGATPRRASARSTTGPRWSSSPAWASSLRSATSGAP